MAEKPTGTSAETVSQTAILVTWTDSADGIEYHVYASLTDFSEAILIGAASAGAELFTAYGLSMDTLYRFYIVAIAADGSQSLPDGPAEATTLALIPAAHPFYAESRSSSSLWLSWTDLEGAEMYFIYLGETDVFEDATMVMSVLQGRQAAVIDGLIAAHDYYVWIVGRVGENHGQASGPVHATTSAQVGGALDTTGLKQAIWAWAAGVVSAAGMTDLVIWANQDGTRPQDRHVQLGLAGPIIIGSGDSLIPTAAEDQVFEQRGLRSFLVSVNAYAPANPGALGLATRLQSSLSNPTLRLPLETANIGVGRVSDARDLSQFVETRWESRVQFDFIIFVTLSDEVVQDLINSVIIKNITPP